MRLSARSVCQQGDSQAITRSGEQLWKAVDPGLHDTNFGSADVYSRAPWSGGEGELGQRSKDGGGSQALVQIPQQIWDARGPVL